MSETDKLNAMQNDVLLIADSPSQTTLLSDLAKATSVGEGFRQVAQRSLLDCTPEREIAFPLPQVFTAPRPNSTACTEKLVEISDSESDARPIPETQPSTSISQLLFDMDFRLSPMSTPRSVLSKQAATYCADSGGFRCTDDLILFDTPPVDRSSPLAWSKASEVGSARDDLPHVGACLEETLTTDLGIGPNQPRPQHYSDAGIEEADDAPLFSRPRNHRPRRVAFRLDSEDDHDFAEPSKNGLSDNGTTATPSISLERRSPETIARSLVRSTSVTLEDQLLSEESSDEPAKEDDTASTDSDERFVSVTPRSGHNVRSRFVIESSPEALSSRDDVLSLTSSCGDASEEENVEPNRPSEDLQSSGVLVYE